MEPKKIEMFFLNTLLRISIIGVALVLVSNLLLSPEDKLSILISAAILAASILSYLIRNKYPTLSVVIVTSVALMAMSYQRLVVPNTSTTLSVVLIVGFIVSIMLRGRVMWIMHCVTFLIINTIFIFNTKSAITAAITYSTLYFIIAYATAVLKSSYDRIHQYLRDANLKLQEKTNELVSQNEELLTIQGNLNALNSDLEKVVNERTAKIQMQNEILIRYSYTNAHHLRGPVARLLGLAAIYDLDSNPNHRDFIDKMVDQANEIDSVIKQINIDLVSNNVEIQ